MLKKIIVIVFSCLVVLSVHMAAANTSTSAYGINVHLSENDVLQKVKDAGIKWIRIDMDWAEIERTTGTFDYARVDRVVNYADANGLSVLAVLAYTPGWANGNKGRNYPADNVYYWKTFVQETVNRYRNAVKYWCIWNEPNLTEFFVPGKDIFVDQVFKPAADSIRGTDSAAFIVGPELSHLTSVGREWYFWMTYILTECGQYIDIVSHHIYKLEGVSHIYDLLETGDNLIPAVKEVIEDAGQGSKPFWITEIGWHTNEVSEEEQGNKYLAMLSKRKEKSYPGKLFFYEIIDDPAPGIHPWGILRSNLGEKPAYTIYKDFIDGKYDDSENGGGDDGGDSKQCFAQKSKEDDSNKKEGKAQALANLRNFRDYLKAHFPASGMLIELYYGMSGEFLELSRSDSRVHRLGRDLLDTVTGAVGDNPRAFLNRQLDGEIIQKMTSLITLLKEKNTSSPMRQLLPWAEKQLELLRVKKITLGRYFSHYLESDSQGPEH
ncbi:MAG: cellulase family glycosylhydrolase [bacterium]|nr:cellulase family glycosylhydrolase [bacterium]